MRKCQVLSEFVILGAILFVLCLLIAYKIEAKKISGYIKAMSDTRRTSIISCIQCVHGPAISKNNTPDDYDDKTLISTQYFNYYFPVNPDNMKSKCGKQCLQKEIIIAISEIADQLKSHDIRYDDKVYNDFKKSLNAYAKCSDKRHILAAGKRLEYSFNRFKTELLKTKSHAAIEGIELIDKFVSQIQELNR